MPFTSWPTIANLAQFRVAKYKQRRVLYTTGRISEDSLKVGACTGLSFEWLQMHRKDPTATPASRVGAFKNDSAFDSIAYFAKVFNSTGSSYEERLKTCGQFSFGRQRDVPVAEERDNVGFATLLKHLKDNPGYHAILMILEFGKNSTNHVCALFQPKGGALTYFDPNSGEYSVLEDRRQYFFQQLVAQYLTYITAAGVVTPVTIDRWIVGAFGA
jgi:hypothetical protein